MGWYKLDCVDIGSSALLFASWQKFGARYLVHSMLCQSTQPNSSTRRTTLCGVIFRLAHVHRSFWLCQSNMYPAVGNVRSAEWYSTGSIYGSPRTRRRKPSTLSEKSCTLRRARQVERDTMCVCGCEAVTNQLQPPPTPACMTVMSHVPLDNGSPAAWLIFSKRLITVATVLFHFIKRDERWTWEYAPDNDVDRNES